MQWAAEGIAPREQIQLRLERSQRKPRAVEKLTQSRLHLLQSFAHNRWRKAAPASAIILLCLLVFLAYGNSLNNGFVWDDSQQLVMNPELRPSASAWQLFSENVWHFRNSSVGATDNYYRPLQMLTYREIAARWGFNARAFHAVNVGFHLLVVLLAFAVFWRLCGRLDLGFAAAAIFAAHPIHSEAVDWISALPDLGCTVFLLLAFLLFLRSTSLRGDSRDGSVGLMLRLPMVVSACASFAAALLWKETAIVFPLLVIACVMCLCDENSLARGFRQGVKLSLPYWCILAAYLIVRLRVLGFLATRQRNWPLNPVQLALTALNLIMRYCAKLVAPFHLNAYYVFSPITSISNMRAVIAMAFLVLMIAALAWMFHRAPLETFAAIWIFVTLIPVLDIYAVGRNVFAERYLYLPSVGFCLLVVLVINKVLQRVSARWRLASGSAALLAIIAVFTATTFARNPDWKDNATLFARTLADSPNAPFVQNMAAETGSSVDDPREAESHYLQAISLAEHEAPPDRLQIALAYQGLSSIYADRSDFDRALRSLQQARSANPSDPELDSQEGMILVQAGRWQEAESALKKAEQEIPTSENVLNALGILEWQHGHKLEEAVNYFRRALAVHTVADDFSASLHSNLAAVYGEEGRLSDAVAEFKIAVATEPSDPEYRTNLAQAYAYEGLTQQARSELETALTISPGYQPARAALQRLTGR